jgi:ribonuclease-3
LTNSFADLCRSVGYRFHDEDLLAAALTHRSAGNRNNERLEFLGDAVLGFIVADELYRRYPEASEGELSRLRASLVKRETLGGFARALEIGRFLTLGAGELKSGGYRRESILADALEALFGAILLDGGFAACRDCVLRLYRSHFEEMPEAARLKDPKTRLQEYLQSRKLDLPSYAVTATEGKAHSQSFTVLCEVGSLSRTSTGAGRSRRKAEQAAAQAMLDELGVQ